MQYCIETALSEDVVQENCDKTPYLGGKHTETQTGVIGWSQAESSRNDFKSHHDSGLVFSA